MSFAFPGLITKRFQTKRTIRKCIGLYTAGNKKTIYNGDQILRLFNY